MKPRHFALLSSLCFSIPVVAGSLGGNPDELLLKDFKPRSIYHVPQTRVVKARYPVIDMHMHDYAKTDAQIADWIRTMDAAGAHWICWLYRASI